MPRRRRSGFFPLPLLVGLFVLAVAYIATISSLGLVVGIATIAAALIYGAYASWEQAVDQRLWEHVKDVSSLSGVAFERHVAETYRRLGYRATVTKQSGDAGADVIAENGIERLAIQTKQYSGSVGNDSVQQAYTGKTIYNCTKAVVVCTSTFTSAAWASARATGVELIDGKGYARLMQQTQPKTLRTRLPIPTGSPLLRELGLLSLGALVLLVHFVGPSLTQKSGDRSAPVDYATATAYTPAPQYTIQPAMPVYTEKPSPSRAKEITNATPTPSPTPTRQVPKHPPWWTAPPSNTPSPTEESSVATPEASMMTGVSPEPVSSPTVTVSPESTP